MLVYKFGGAAVKDAKTIRLLLPLIAEQKDSPLLIVVSAMGKMTNAFEQLLSAYRSNDKEKEAFLNSIKEYHYSILADLFEQNHSIFAKIEVCFSELENELENSAAQAYDFAYDQIVSFGELLSSRILSDYLNENQLLNNWVDVSDLIITNDKYRDAHIDWETTKAKVLHWMNRAFSQVNIVVTQGFIGGTKDGYKTTLGREGSDFSAAILANCLNARQLTVWKDVPGILNANPKEFPQAKNLKHLSYHETVELAFYGASVIHPRTLQPLKMKNIPLFIRSFLQPHLSSIVDNQNRFDSEIPTYILKENQILFTISSRDFDFIDAEKLTAILKLFSDFHFHIRLIQNSALNFSLVADENPLQLEELLFQLKTDYSVRYNRNLSMLSIRHSKDNRIAELFGNTEILLEMQSRASQQFVMRSDVLQNKMAKINRLV